jgi:hypothetical protein
VFSWLCHGTATMLASMFPDASLAYLQTGFRTPELYTLVMVRALDALPWCVLRSNDSIKGRHCRDRDL